MPTHQRLARLGSGAGCRDPRWPAHPGWQRQEATKPRPFVPANTSPIMAFQIANLQAPQRPSVGCLPGPRHCRVPQPATRPCRVSAVHATPIHGAALAPAGLRPRRRAAVAQWRHAAAGAADDAADAAQERAYVTALLLAFIAAQNRSLFAARCLVEIVVEMYRAGLRVDDVAVRPCCAATALHDGGSWEARGAAVAKRP